MYYVTWHFIGWYVFIVFYDVM